jgi:hypothetical protein
MEKHYVGGVSEETRTEQERRFDQLGLETFFWSFISLQRHVDDVEDELKALRSEAS